MYEEDRENVNGQYVGQDGTRYLVDGGRLFLCTRKRVEDRSEPGALPIDSGVLTVLGSEEVKDGKLEEIPFHQIRGHIAVLQKNGMGLWKRSNHSLDKVDVLTRID